MSEPPTDTLPPRVNAVCALVAEGLSNKEIGRQLGIEEGTVKTQVMFACRKFGVNRRTALALRWKASVERGGALEHEAPDMATLRQLVDAGVDLRVIRQTMAAAPGFDLAGGLLAIAREVRV